MIINPLFGGDLFLILLSDVSMTTNELPVLIKHDSLKLSVVYMHAIGSLAPGIHKQFSD